MWGDAAWAEVAYAEPPDGTIPPFQDRRVFAVIELVADGAGQQLDPGVGAASFGFVALGVMSASRRKVKVIQTDPKSGIGRTGISHTGME